MTLSYSIKASLTMNFYDAEIYEAVCSIGDDKGPDPYGFTTCFYLLELMLSLRLNGSFTQGYETMD